MFKIINKDVLKEKDIKIGNKMEEIFKEMDKIIEQFDTEIERIKESKWKSK